MSAEFYIDEEVSSQEQDIQLSAAWRKLWPFLRHHKRRLWISLGFLITATALSLVWPWMVKVGIDGPIASQLEKGLEFRELRPLIWLGAGIVLVQALTLLLLYVQRVQLETIGQDIMLELKRTLFDHILSQDIGFFDGNPVGRLLARVESDTESLRLLFTNTVILVVGDLILMAGIYVVLFMTDWRLALIIFGALPLLSVMVYIFHKLTTHRFLEVRRRTAEVTATITEFLHGMSIVQIFHRGEYARRRAYRVNERKFSEDAYVNVAVCIFFNTMFFLEYVKIGLVLLLGALWGVSAGTIVLFILMIWREFDPIARTADQLGSFQKGMAGARRIFALLTVESRIKQPKNPVAWHGLSQSIKFENVSFSYTDDDNYALRNVSFEIPVGKRVALAGVTGGGKTTVISLLLRLYDPQKGRIMVDGIDIRDIRLADLRRRFALVLQDIILFPGSVTDNIGLEADDITEERILRAAETVEADRFIRRLPDAYDTEVSEKGSNFSRGERQLLSFARALAVDPDVLILDEATSSVDPETERTVQASLKKLMRGRTSLIIAHRLSTILDVDEILVIRHGEIVESGSHTELILADGYYSRLFHLQFKNANGVTSNAT